MPERPHSRKVKIVEGVAEVKKGGKLQDEVRASQRSAPETQDDKKQETGEK